MKRTRRPRHPDDQRIDAWVRADTYEKASTEAFNRAIPLGQLVEEALRAHLGMPAINYKEQPP